MSFFSYLGDLGIIKLDIINLKNTKFYRSQTYFVQVLYLFIWKKIDNHCMSEFVTPCGAQFAPKAKYIFQNPGDSLTNSSRGGGEVERATL